MATSLLMWEARAIRLGSGVIHYRDEDEGPELLFVHGIFANGTLWREVVPKLSEDFRCVVPDLPLGGHVVPLDLDTGLLGGGPRRGLRGGAGGLTSLVAAGADRRRDRSDA